MIALLPPQFPSFLNGIPRIQSTPHVPQCLPVTRTMAFDPSTVPFGVAAHVALTGGAVDDLDFEMAGRRKITLQVHVKIFPNRLGSGVPATDPLGEKQRDGVNRGRDANGRVPVQSRQAGPTPENVGNPDERRNDVSVSVEDDRSDVHGRVGGLVVSEMLLRDQREVIGGQMSVRYARTPDG